MKSTWFPILLIVALLGLLVLLATLQYQWLGQISESEQIRLEERLKDDTKRFADDFNNVMQQTYFLFQTTDEDWNTFSKRYELWKEKSQYKNLIKDFFYVEINDERKITTFDKDSGNFKATVWTDELKQIAKSFRDTENYQSFSSEGFALILPIYKSRVDVKKMVGQQKRRITLTSKSGELLREDIVGPENAKDDAKKVIQKIIMPDKLGFLIIRLDKKVVYEEILHNLTNKYFSEKSVGGSYKVSVTDENDIETFKNYIGEIEKSDAQVKFFDLMDKNIFFFEREQSIPIPKNGAKREVTWSSSQTTTSIETETLLSDEKRESIDVDIISKEQPKTTVIKNSFPNSNGIWTLNVQHIDGSLEQFIDNTRKRNLAISFGILSLLAISIILIFISSQKAKLLAQKQMDFVSSVSHEFRTPLAVIYSAGENLSDGVINETAKIANYGTLIKREGKKLSGMVEQILEFAGANSGKRKFDFKNIELDKVVKNALAECQSIIDEKGFQVETDLMIEPANIIADENALTLAVQNLINNSIKYSNGNKWLKVSTEKFDEMIKITVEDKGIGISPKDKKQIFEPFYRAENVVDEQISGNGLGLSLVKQIVDAHKGSIEVESVLGKGSKFTINLPLI